MTKPVVVRAVITRMATEDQMMSIAPGHRLGEECFVDLTTRQEVHLVHVSGSRHSKVMVQDAMDEGWWPWECLEVRP